MAGRRLLGRNTGDRVVAAAGLAALAFGLITLGVLLADVLADGLTHPQEFERLDQLFAKEVEFTRSLPR